jgi:lysophospholipase L1-like esterase
VIRRIFLAAVLALATGSASASATTATAFGDSFTAPSTTWYYKLALGDDNFAKSGAVCNSALTSLAGKRLTTQVKKWTAAGKPVGNDLMLFIGINDVQLTDNLEASKSAYRTAVGTFNPAVIAAGGKLILVQIPDLGRMPLYKGTAKQATMTTRSQAWNTFVNEVAETYGTRIVDLFNLLADPRLIGPDKLHPNARGQKVIADAIAAQL